VGGTRERRFGGTSSKPRKLPQNAATPTRRVHAVLGNHTERKTRELKKNNTTNLTKLLHEPLLLTITKLEKPRVV